MADTNTTNVQEFLKTLAAGEGQCFGNLTLFPLFSNIKTSYNYLTLDEAFDAEVLSVTEIDFGTVPDIKMHNHGSKDIFIMDGEELTGAKQNRIINISLIVPAGSEVIIPVSCVEKGRWQNTSAEFKKSQNMSYAGLRKKHKESVIHSMELSNTFQSDQGEVWEEIEGFMNRKNTFSPTSAMSDIYEKEKIRIKDYRDAFKTVAGQTGSVFAIGREIFAMDVFDSVDTCRKLMPKIISSCAIEALDNVSDKKADFKDVKAFLDVVSASDLSLKKSPGAGVTVSIKSPAASGTSLVSGDTVVHTAVFNTHEENYSYVSFM